MRGFSRPTVYFASGTGNSYLVAAWFRDTCETNGVPAALIPMTRAEPSRNLAPSASELVGLAFPTHGGLPPNWRIPPSTIPSLSPPIFCFIA